MTASLYTFRSTDGGIVEINTDQINYMRPYTYSLPTGVGIGTTINVRGIDVTVENSLADINSVLSSTLIPQILPPMPIPVFPTVMGSSQTDPFRLIDRRMYELWTRENSPDGMPWRLFRSVVVILPPWLGGSSAATGNYGWSNKVLDLPPYGSQPIDQFIGFNSTGLIGADVLPFRINTDLPRGSLPLMDTNYSNLLTNSIP